jgi:hypothetical protein
MKKQLLTTKFSSFLCFDLVVVGMVCQPDTAARVPERRHLKEKKTQNANKHINGWTKQTKGESLTKKERTKKTGFVHADDSDNLQ